MIAKPKQDNADMTNAYPNQGVTPLPEMGVIWAQGDDAVTFLHSQLSQDVNALAIGEARPSTYCSAKGRMLANPWLLRREDGVVLLVPRAAVEPLIKRLRLFVLRAKVTLHDRSDDWPVLGLWGSAAVAQPGATVALPPAPEAPRAYWVGGTDAPSPHPSAHAQDAAAWHWLQVRSGMVPLPPALAETLVPQMLNLESLDAVHFQKGCYPGQEVVARSQFRGAIKRRGVGLRAAQPVAVGSDVLDASQSPCGVVVAAAAAADGACDILASVLTEAANQGKLSAQGHALTPFALPYALRHDL